MTHTLFRRARTTAAATALTVALTAGLSACGSDTDADARDDASATTSSADALVVEDPWVRSTDGAKDATMTAAFMVLDNSGDEELTLVGASTDVAGTVELHEMVMSGGKAVMQEVDGGITLAPGKGQLLQPGGMHVMLMGLGDDLAAGDEVELVLELADGSTQEVTAPVKAFTEEDEHYHAPGTPDHEH